MIEPVPLQHANPTEWVKVIARTVNGLLNGRQNNTGSFTLTASATSTVVSDLRVGIDSVILFSPKTANAAAEYGTIYISAVTKEQFTVTHANTADVDKTFDYVVVG